MKRRYRPPRARRRRLWALALGALALAAIVLLLPRAPKARFVLAGTPDPAYAGHSLRIHVLDVGQGDCLLLEQEGAFALLDTGTPQTPGDVLACLRRQGVARLDYLILTHLHADHIGGALALLQTLPVGTVLLPDTPDALAPTSAVALELLEYLAQPDAAFRVCMPAAGERFALGRAELEVLSGGLAGASDLNDTSLALRLTFDNFSMYAAGDAGAAAEQALLARGGLAGADLYKVSHHGSATSTSAALLAALRPLAAVVSCGANNEYGHPHREVLQRLSDAGVPLWRTDQNGTVVVTVCDGVMTLTCERAAG